jgi:hypothetical protein
MILGKKDVFLDLDVFFIVEVLHFVHKELQFMLILLVYSVIIILASFVCKFHYTKNTIV